jgi:hypothetical protein
VALMAADPRVADLIDILVAERGAMRAAWTCAGLSRGFRHAAKRLAPHDDRRAAQFSDAADVMIEAAVRCWARIDDPAPVH